MQSAHDNSVQREISSLPPWLKRPLGKASEISTVQQVIKKRQIHTICEEGRCPNRGECYAQKTATFLLMGSTCTRACAFCQVDKGRPPQNLDPQEPQKVAEAVNVLGLRYVVLTSVARDDLADGGASCFTATMAAIRSINPQTQIEVLTPDFWSGKDAVLQQRQRVAQVIAANPACYNHNIETVRRLQDQVRRGAKYERSLAVLRLVKETSTPHSHQIRLNVRSWGNRSRSIASDGRFAPSQVRSPYPGTVSASFFTTSSGEKILDS